MKRMLTIRLDEVTIRKAKVLAARRSISLSRFVAQELTRLVQEDDAYEQARVEAPADLESGFDLGSHGQLPDPRGGVRALAGRATAPSHQD
jgi:hypothetical protein